MPLWHGYPILNILNIDLHNQAQSIRLFSNKISQLFKII